MTGNSLREPLRDTMTMPNTLEPTESVGAEAQRPPFAKAHPLELIDGLVQE